MRGRKPHPTALKLLRNNPGRRPLNTREPQHGALDPAVPSYLTDPVAVAEWQRIVGTLGQGHVTLVDRATLSAYCQKFAEWLEYEALKAAHPRVIKYPNGAPMPSPYISMANKALTLMLRAAVELGITPSSRARIVLADLTPADGLDAFSVFQRKRARAPG